VEETLRLEQVADLLKDHAVLDAESDRLVHAESGLLEALLTELQAKNRVERPRERIRIIQDVSLADRVLRRRQLIQSNERKTEVDPCSSLHAVLAHLQEDSLGILPRSAHRINYSETDLEHIILQLCLATGLNSECVDVGLLRVEEILHQEVGVASQNPGFLVIRV